MSPSRGKAPPALIMRGMQHVMSFVFLTRVCSSVSPLLSLQAGTGFPISSARLPPLDTSLVAAAATQSENAVGQSIELRIASSVPLLPLVVCVREGKQNTRHHNITKQARGAR